ncbi:hypothetical protein [Pseudobacillus badius]|uniref:hypothetical protein n=1 Tax=Bacillus badius TaxID=1455 RepID=UPI0024A39ED2|nr:hypothetical protein [Bacillus badius]GLY09603.1 hypothetical protein Bbad01_08190 [Bacillus badius]
MELTNTQTVIIDFRHTTTVPLPRYIQYDSNILKFIIKDKGKDADLSNVNKIVVSTKRPDGIITQRLLQADGNIITYNIGNEEQRVVGYAELTLQFFNMEKLLSSRRLKVYFGESLGAEFKDGAGYPILQELFIEVGEAVNQTIDAGNFALEKAEMANEAATNANEATQAANLAIENANVATADAQQATQAATDAANAANTAAQEATDATDAATRAAQTANSAAIKANDATASANEAAANATDAASTANIAATNADEKATLADEKAGLAQAKVDELSNLDQTLTQSIANANTATEAATEAATIAETQAGHAKTQGDYAKAQGDKVQDILDAGGAVVSVNGKTGADIKLTADDVGAETPQKAQEKANVAESNAKDYTDQQIENIPPPDLSGLATKEEVDAHLAETKQDAHVIANIKGLATALQNAEKNAKEYTDTAPEAMLRKTGRFRKTNSQKDPNIRTYLVREYRRKDGTLFVRSVLSDPNADGKPTVRTETFYEADGVTEIVADRIVFDIVYDADGDYKEEIPR